MILCCPVESARPARERLLRQPLHRALRAHRHERRRIDDSVGSRETSQAARPSDQFSELRSEIPSYYRRAPSGARARVS